MSTQNKMYQMHWNYISLFMRIHLKVAVPDEAANLIYDFPMWSLWCISLTASAWLDIWHTHPIDFTSFGKLSRRKVLYPWHVFTETLIQNDCHKLDICFTSRGGWYFREAQGYDIEMLHCAHVSNISHTVFYQSYYLKQHLVYRITA